MKKFMVTAMTLILCLTFSLWAQDRDINLRPSEAGTGPSVTLPDRNSEGVANSLEGSSDTAIAIPEQPRAYNDLITGGGCLAIDQPDPDYTGGTGKCTMGDKALFSTTTTCKDQIGPDGQTLATFSNPLSVRQVPMGWATWSSPPDSETATPWVGFNQSATLTVTLADGTEGNTVGMEIENNVFEPAMPVTVSFKDADGNEVAAVTRDVLGRAGAKLFAVDCTDVGVIKSMAITASPGAQGFAIAQVRSDGFAAARGPKCDNCHAVVDTKLECAHFTEDPTEACSTTQCIRNMMNTASCDFHADRTGAPNCNTKTLGGTPQPPEVVQELRNSTCATTDTGGFHLWRSTYFGCDTTCTQLDHMVRCVTDQCGGTLVESANRGMKKACGC